MRARRIIMIIAAACSVIALVILAPTPAWAWGPITHVALGVQVLATVITPGHPIEATLAALPEVFLYGSLAPDIVQGRRLQSRLRRHSHNWATGLGLLKSARGAEQHAFALGYLAHLAGDVVAHNFFLPARFVGRYDSGIASHLLTEARFDSFQDADYRDLLVNLVRADFRPLNRMLQRAVETPFFGFSTHRRIFEGGLRRIRQFDSAMKALGGPNASETEDIELFSQASCGAISGVLHDPHGAAACRFDPMGEQAVRSALALRRNLQRLNRLGPKPSRTARRMAATMLDEMRLHLRESPFTAVTAAS